MRRAFGIGWQCVVAGLIGAGIIALVWTFWPISDTYPDLCVTCMSDEGQRLAIIMGVTVTLVVLGIVLFLAEFAREPWHGDYDGCDACNWQADGET